MPIVRNAQLNVVGTTGSDHSIALGDVECHRLFTQDMFASFGGGDCLFSVQVNWSGDVEGVDLLVHQQLLPLRIPALRAEFTRKRLCEMNPCPADRDQFAQWRIAQCRSDALARDVAATD